MTSTETDRRRYFGVWRQVENDYQVWEVDGNRAIRFGDMNAKNVNAHNLDIEIGKIFEVAIVEKITSIVGNFKWEVAEMRLPPGAYHPRMARPMHLNPTEPASHFIGASELKHEYAIIIEKIKSLLNKLAEICRFVHPDGPSLAAYGHEIRNLLILTCTEVESHWRSILKANKVNIRNYSTSDYLLLKDAMKLGDYSITFNLYPWLPPLAPFENWGISGSPTKDIPWYDAYNAVKHHREENFARGTLEATLNAVAACAIMVCAQFGNDNPIRSMNGLIGLRKAPTWYFPEFYIFAMYKSPTVRISYSFPVDRKKRESKSKPHG